MLEKCNRLSHEDVKGAQQHHIYGPPSPHGAHYYVGKVTNGQYKDRLFLRVADDGFPNRYASAEVYYLLPEHLNTYEEILKYLNLPPIKADF